MSRFSPALRSINVRLGTQLLLTLNRLENGRYSIHDSDSLIADLWSVGYKYDSAGRLVLEAKEDLRRRGMPSPDEGDAMALCFTQTDGAVFVPLTNFNRPIIYNNAGIV